MNTNREIIKLIISHLKSLKKKTQKITMQKIIFYLSENGVQLPYHFEPYTYGPFSKELAIDLDDMDFLEEIAVSGANIEKGSAFKIDLDEELQNTVKEKINGFINLVEKMSFDNMELYTTLMYNIKALKEMGQKSDFEAVLKEFKAWKGNKFRDEKIQSAYDSITLAQN